MATTTIPQTLTMMEACFTLVPGIEDDFWRAQERFGPIAAAAPGFRGVLGGPIANSSWLYFGGIFESPEHMNEWHHNKQHRPVQDMAHSTWFGAYYIRKWRLPADGESVSGRTLSATWIGREQPLSEDEQAAVLSTLNGSLPQYNPMPFETLNGQYEENPYQFVGPLEEAPQPAPVRYLLLTHWESADDARKWLDSEAMAKVRGLGDVSTDLFLPIYHEAGERGGLREDGMHREWARA